MHFHNLRPADPVNTPRCLKPTPITAQSLGAHAQAGTEHVTSCVDSDCSLKHAGICWSCKVSIEMHAAAFQKLAQCNTSFSHHSSLQFCSKPWQIQNHAHHPTIATAYLITMLCINVEQHQVVSQVSVLSVVYIQGLSCVMLLLKLHRFPHVSSFSATYDSWMHRAHRQTSSCPKRLCLKAFCWKTPVYQNWEKYRHFEQDNAIPGQRHRDMASLIPPRKAHGFSRTTCFCKLGRLCFPPSQPWSP